LFREGNSIGKTGKEIKESGRGGQFQSTGEGSKGLISDVDMITSDACGWTNRHPVELSVREKPPSVLHANWRNQCSLIRHVVVPNLATLKDATDAARASSTISLVNISG